MPMYQWRCTKCKKDAEIIRSFDGYMDPPTKEEGGEGDCEHEWDRVIGAPLTVKGPAWGPGKGYW